MTVSAEVMLATAIIVLYLYDATEWLAANEFVLLRNGSDWSYRFASQRWQLRNGNLYLPNPLRPDRDQFIVTWTAMPAPPVVPALHRYVQAAKGLRVLVSMQFALTVVALPIALLLGVADLVLLALLAAVYASTVAVSVALLRARERLGLSRKRALLLAAECVVCPPFASNLIRKLTSRHFLFADPLDFARGRMPAARYAFLVTETLHRIDELLTSAEPESDRFIRLRDRRRLVEELRA